MKRFSFAATRSYNAEDYRRWVVSCAAMATVGYSVVLLAGLLTYGVGGHSTVTIQAVTTIICASAWVLARQGRSAPAAWMVLSSVWLEVHLSFLAQTTFPTVGSLAIPVLVAAAALMLGPRPSMLFAIVSVLVGPLFVWLSPVGAQAFQDPHTIYWYTVSTVVTFAIWGLEAVGLRALGRVVSRAVEKERELAETIRFAPDGILVVAGDDRVLSINPAALRIVGLTEAQCLRQPLATLLSATGAGSDLPAAWRRDDTIEAPVAMQIVRADGARSFLEVTWRRMNDERRQLSVRDVTERVQAEESRRVMETQLAHSQRLDAVGQLAGGIAHDFNNLLTAVSGSAELLREELKGETHAGLLDEIIAAQERGAKLTKQLLSFARREIVQPKVFDVSVQISELKRLLQRVAGEQVQVVCDLQPDCRIRADVGQIEQALVNLVTNARDAMPDGGPCYVRVLRIAGPDGTPWVALSVSDQGVGMDEDARARAFEPFFTTKPRGRGTGLGLASVHGIVLQSGGHVRLESVPRGGTTVTLEFPLALSPVDRSSTPRDTTPVQRGGATILVAEDDDGTRGVVDRILQRAGYRVLLAPDGVAALRLAERQATDVDLLLTDVMMPGLSGPQLAASVRARNHELPVIFMSGYPEDALGHVPGLVLQRDFIAKPFSSAQLLQCVGDALRRRGLTPSGPHLVP